jgi:hypothetical protein
MGFFVSVGGGGGTAAQIASTPAGGLSADDVQEALNELDSEKASAASLTAHLDDASDAHDASAISFAPAGGLSATDVQAALAELDSEKASSASMGLVPIDTFVFSAAAALAITGLSSTYLWSLLVWTITCSNDDVEVLGQTDSDGGASPDGGVNDYMFALGGTNSGATTQAVGSTAPGDLDVHLLTGAAINKALGNAAGKHLTLRMWVYRGDGTKHPHVSWEGGYVTADGEHRRLQGNAARLSATAIDTIVLTPEAGTLSAVCYHYGLAVPA